MRQEMRLWIAKESVIEWLDVQSAKSVMSKDKHDCDEQKSRAKQEQDAAFTRLNRKCEAFLLLKHTGL